MANMEDFGSLISILWVWGAQQALKVCSFIWIVGFAILVNQIMEPNRAVRDAAVLRHQICRPRQVGLSSAFHKTPLEASHIARLENGELVFDLASNRTCHPFGAKHRAAQF